MKRKFDIMSLIGVLLAFGLIVFGIVFGKDPETEKYVVTFSTIKNFIDPPSIIIVVGGVLVVAAAVGIPVALYLKKKADKKKADEAIVSAYARKKIDTTDDKSIDVYADEEAEAPAEEEAETPVEETEEPVEEAVEEPAEEATEEAEAPTEE
jgi:NAD-dependent SIR2 family protein deacetylase